MENLTERIIVRHIDTQAILMVGITDNTEEFVRRIKDNPIYGIWGIDYDFEFYPMTEEQVQALQTLEETDWYVIRFHDPSSGREIPQEVLDIRTAAREIL